MLQPGEQDEKLRKIQFEKDNLQLQVQVLTEQIEAQSDKILDLEKMLQEKKTLLSDAEDKLQRVSSVVFGQEQDFDRCDTVPHVKTVNCHLP